MESVKWCNMEVQNNDEISLVETFNTYYDKVLKYFSYHINNPVDAQDLTGEVFVKVAAAWHRYDASKSAISTWIFTIARNVLYDFWRKKKHTLVELQDIQVTTDCFDHIEREDDTARLKKALSCLSSKERELIALKYASEMKNTEIASVTGMTSSNVGTMLFRALRKLREEMRLYAEG